jgi:large subunit ribosomal protein L1
MGKVKTIVMGDEQAEEEARKKAAEKRAQKKIEKATAPRHSGEPEATPESPIVEEPKKTKRDSGRGQNDVKHDKYTFNRGQRYLEAKALVDESKIYPLGNAIDLVKKTSYSSFDGAAELLLNVLDKGIRGTVSLPHGTGKEVRVRVVDDALLADLEKRGPAAINFDILVAHPSLMPKLAKVAKVLGPRGLMPNPKTGTIGEKPEELVKTLSKGQVQFKTETDFPIIHAVIGRVSFEDKMLSENFAALIKAVGKDKIRSAYLKATMGPAIRVAI